MKKLSQIKSLFTANSTANANKVKNYQQVQKTFQEAGKVYYKVVSLKEKKQNELESLISQQEALYQSGYSSSSYHIQQIASEITEKQNEINSLQDDEVFTEEFKKEIIAVPSRDFIVPGNTNPPNPINNIDDWANYNDTILSNFYSDTNTPLGSKSGIIDPITKEADATRIIDKQEFSVQNFQTGIFAVPTLDTADYVTNTEETPLYFEGVGGNPSVSIPTITISIPNVNIYVHDEKFQIDFSWTNWDSVITEEKFNIFVRDHDSPDAEWIKITSVTKSNITDNSSHSAQVPMPDFAEGGKAVSVMVGLENYNDHKVYSEIFNVPIMKVVAEGNSSPSIYSWINAQNYGVAHIPWGYNYTNNFSWMSEIPIEQRDYGNFIYHDSGVYTNRQHEFGGWFTHGVNNINNGYIQTEICKPSGKTTGVNSFWTYHLDGEINAQDPNHILSNNNSTTFVQYVLIDQRFAFVEVDYGYDQNGTEFSIDVNNSKLNAYFRPLDDDGNPTLDWISLKPQGFSYSLEEWTPGVQFNKEVNYQSHKTILRTTEGLRKYGFGHCRVEYKYEFIIANSNGDSTQKSFYHIVDSRTHTKPMVHFVVEEQDPDGNANYLNGIVKYKAQVQPQESFPTAFTTFNPTLFIHDAVGNSVEIENLIVKDIGTYQAEDWMKLNIVNSFVVEGTIDTSQYPDGNYEIALNTQVSHYNPTADYVLTHMMLRYNSQVIDNIATNQGKRWRGYQINNFHVLQSAIYNEGTDPPSSMAYMYIPNEESTTPWFDATTILSLQNKGYSNRIHDTWRRTPWMHIISDENSFINKVILDYKSNVPIKVKIYGDYNESPITTINFSSTGGVRKLISKRTSARAKTFQFDIGSTHYMLDLGDDYPSDTIMELYDMEVNVDEFK